MFRPSLRVLPGAVGTLICLCLVLGSSGLEVRAQEPSDAPPVPSGPAPEPGRVVPGEVTQAVIDGQQPEREERIRVALDAIVYTFTNRGGTLSAAVLQDPRFTQAGRAPVAGAPADKVAEGQIDLVTTWGTKWLPFQTVFGKLSYPGQATLVVRRAKAGPVTGAAIKAGVLEAPRERHQLLVDRPVAKDDLLKVIAPASVAGEYRVASIGAGGSITPAQPFALSAVEGVSYEITRSGAVDQLYASDRDFVRVSEAPGLPLTYVWPNPATDDSPIWIERRIETGAHPYELKLAVTVHNLGDQLAQVQTGLRIGSWQHPEAGGQSMFGLGEVLQGSCLALDGLEDAAFSSLREDAVEKWEMGQPAVELQSYPTGTQWVSIDTNYFIQAAVPTPFSELGGQCQLGLRDFNPRVPGAWAMWAQFTASNVVEIPGRVDACLPDWLPPTNPHAPDGDRCEGYLNLLGLTDASSLRSVKSAWEKARSGAGDVAAVDRAYEILKSRRQATWRFNLYNGPKDTELLAMSHPDLTRSVRFGWMSFIGAPMHKVLLWFHGGIGSWPLAIVLITILLKLITWPLSQKSYTSMQKMKNLKPKLDELKKRVGNDRQRFAQEQMALMKREGVNPFAGCLPMLLQLPIWVGLYGAILGSVELYHEPLGLWIPDLAAPDPYYVMPIMVGAIQFVQMMLTPQTTTDATQAKIMKYGMPVMFTVFMLFLPSALVLYILINSILTIGQNLLIKRKMEATA